MYLTYKCLTFKIVCLNFGVWISGGLVNVIKDFYLLFYLSCNLILLSFHPGIVDDTLKNMDWRQMMIYDCGQIHLRICLGKTAAQHKTTQTKRIIYSIDYRITTRLFNKPPERRPKDFHQTGFFLSCFFLCNPLAWQSCMSFLWFLSATEKLFW